MSFHIAFNYLTIILQFMRFWKNFALVIFQEKNIIFRDFFRQVFNDKNTPHTHALYMFDGCFALECYCTGTKDYCEHLLNNDPFYKGCTLVELTHPWKRSED